MLVGQAFCVRRYLSRVTVALRSLHPGVVRRMHRPPDRRCQGATAQCGTAQDFDHWTLTSRGDYIINLAFTAAAFAVEAGVIAVFLRNWVLLQRSGKHWSVRRRHMSVLYFTVLCCQVRGRRMEPEDRQTEAGAPAAPWGVLDLAVLCALCVPGRG
jgi:hypothetical protein